jgi:hypothetical protein
MRPHGCPPLLGKGGDFDNIVFLLGLLLATAGLALDVAALPQVFAGGDVYGIFTGTLSAVYTDWPKE